MLRCRPVVSLPVLSHALRRVRFLPATRQCCVLLFLPSIVAIAVVAAKQDGSKCETA